MFGAIEAGGTKFVCAVGDENLAIHERVSFPTTTPEETLKNVITFFKKYDSALKGIGIGSFGPIDIKKESETYGYITTTPKEHWKSFNFLGKIKEIFNIPITWTTDVNAACYGEYSLGHAVGLSSVVYFTIGTGVGGGAIQDGHFIEGFNHPEMGHMLIRTNEKDSFSGSCPFHENCLEGLASGSAIAKRFGKSGAKIPADNPFWSIEADYIAQCIYNTTLMFSPDKIILGGGVIKKEGLVEGINSRFHDLMNSYVNFPNSDYISTPKLGDNAGIIGCLALAKKYDETF